MKHFAVTVFVLSLFVFVSGCESENQPQPGLNIQSVTKKSLNQSGELTQPVGDTNQANPVSGKAARKQIAFLPIPEELNGYQVSLKQKGDRSSLITFVRTGSQYYNLTLTRQGKRPVNVRDVFVHFIDDIGTVDLDDSGSEALFFVSRSGGSGAEQRDLYLLSPQKKELLNLGMFRTFNATTPIPDVSTSSNFNEARLTSERDFLQKIKYEYGYIGEKDILKQQQNPRYAYYLWAKDNGKVRDGKLKLRMYKGKPKFGASSVVDLQDGDISYISYFRSGVEGYDLKSNEHFVIFHPESMYSTAGILKKSGPYLFIGTDGEGLVIVNVKTWHLKQDESLGDVRDIEILDTIIRINKTTEIPFPSF